MGHTAKVLHPVGQFRRARSSLVSSSDSKSGNLSHQDLAMASITRIVMTNCSRNALAWRPASAAMWNPAVAAPVSQSQSLSTTAARKDIDSAAMFIGYARNPSLKQQLFSYAILGFALSEAMGLFCLMMAFLLLFAF